MRMHRYINENGLMKLDRLVRLNVLRVVYKGRSAFVYPT